MKSKLFLSLLTIPLLLSSCSSYGSHYLLKDIDGCFSNEVFRKFDLVEVEKMMNTNNEFMIYFSSTGCSSCDQITEVLKDYLPTNRVLMYNLDYLDQRETVEFLVAKYPDTFKLEFPSMYIMKGTKVTQIPSTKLNSSTRISNTFYEYQHNANVYYSNTNIIENIKKEPNKIPFSTFGYISFDFDNESLMNGYNTHLSSYLESLDFPVILCDFVDIEKQKPDQLFAAKLSVNQSGNIGTKNQTLTSDFSNIEFIKTVLNS